MVVNSSKTNNKTKTTVVQYLNDTQISTLRMITAQNTILVEVIWIFPKNILSSSFLDFFATPEMPNDKTRSRLFSIEQYTDSSTHTTLRRLHRYDDN